MEWIVEAETLSDFVDHERYTISTKPLIRCRDCKYYQTRKKNNYLPMCCFSNLIREPDDYCSMAERRTDE